jgi:hypothetical protein
MRHDSESLGPLPKADRNAELQRRSIAVFQASLPPDKFVFRNEPADDAGVDGSLEALVDGEYTNLRSQVQLKSTDSDDRNADGSISVQVRVSNLNYLLNGPSPVYVLYVEPWNELRFAWARDERRRLDGANPAWNQQERITIRFDAIVTPETLEQIHQRIREEAQFQRKVNDILDVASSTEQIVIRINKDTLAVTDPQEAKRILINSGTVIVSAGYAREVKNLIKLLDEKDAQTPRVLLVYAHAEFNLQRYESALALVGEASLNLDALSQEDRIFLQTIRDGSEFQTGRISITEFARRLDETSRSDAGGFALSNRLEQLRYNIFAERNPERRATLLSELEALVKEIVQSEVSHSLKIHARTCWVEAEGHQFIRVSLREMGDSRIRLAAGLMTDFPSMFSLQAARLAKWEEQAVALLRDAIDMGNPFLVANAMLTRGNIAHGVLTNQKMLSVMFGQPVRLSEEFIQNNIGNAQLALETFSLAGNLEGELRARMLLADLYDLIGREAEAQEIARDVLPKAKAMNYAALIGRAEDHLSGRSLQNKLADSARPKAENEKVTNRVQTGDQELRQLASQMLKILDLPVERLPVMEREYESYRDIAREQLNWCRHIELIQDLRHTLDPSTHFRSDPTRLCVCKLHGYRSTLGNPDWRAVILAFKTTYCEGCRPDKSPLEDSADNASYSDTDP